MFLSFQGFSYKKLLCACYDISILIQYSKKSFFNFIYHDGVFESLDDRKKEMFINELRSLTKKYGFQYILTLIESDSPFPISKFKSDEIALELDDRDKDRGKLFGFSF